MVKARAWQRTNHAYKIGKSRGGGAHLVLKRKGWKQQAMADALGITKGAVSQWMGAVREQGDEALCAHPHIGAVAKLSAAQRSQIPEFLSHGAESYSFRGEVWTCARVARVIAQEFGVTYHPAHVSRLLKTLEWTPQKPVERATQRDEQQIAAWREETWTELKKRRGANVAPWCLLTKRAFTCCPASFVPMRRAARAPVLRVFQTRDHLSAVSGITPRGQLATMVSGCSISGKESVRFLRHLQSYVADRLLGIWDGAPIHRGAAVKEFLAQGGAPAVHLEQLPGYAPDLNPDEGVWQHLKHVEMRNLCCTDLKHLRHELNAATVRLRKRPDLIQSLFAGVGLEI